MFTMILLVCVTTLNDCRVLEVPRHFPTARACVAAIGEEVASRAPAARRAECNRAGDTTTENGDDQ